MSNIVPYIMAIIEVACLYILAEGFFKRRNDSNLLLMAVIVMHCLLSIGLESVSYFGNMDRKTIVFLMCFVVTLGLLYKGNIIQKIIIILVYYIFFYSIDYMVLMLMLNVTQVSVDMFNANDKYVLINMITSKCILFSFTALFYRYGSEKKTYSSASMISWLQMLIIPICLILNLCNLCLVVFECINENRLSLWFLGDVLLLIGCNFVLIALEDKMNKDRKAVEESQLLVQEMKLRSENSKILMENYKEQRKLSHDFNNHLQVISSLLESDDSKGAQQYISELVHESNKVQPMVNTENNILNAILNYKYKKAQEKNISIEFNIGSLKYVKLKNEELIIVLGNLLDNAIEACDKINEGERKILVKINSSVDETNIAVRNTIGEDIKVLNKNIETTKKDKKKHGYGVKNVKQIVDKYEGNYLVNSKDGWFQFVLLI